MILGVIVLILADIAIICMIVASIELALRDSDKERVERLAEIRFKEMLDTAEIRIHHRLEIVDEYDKKGRS